MTSQSSAPDIYKVNVADGITPFPYWPNNNAMLKTPVSPAIVPGERTLVLVLTGQSNMAGHNLESYTPQSSRIHNFNFLSGGVYQAANPMLGCTAYDATWGAGYATGYGHHALRTADKLIAAGKTDRVILAPMAVAATLTAQWAAGGNLSPRIAVMGARLEAAGLLPPAVTLFILQNLGEADTGQGVSQAAGTANRQSIVAQWNAALPGTPFFEALCTFNGVSVTNAPANVTSTRNAQMSVVDNRQVFQGPDTDTITAAADRDGPHFTASGSDKHAALWVNVLSRYL